MQGQNLHLGMGRYLETFCGFVSVPFSCQNVIIIIIIIIIMYRFSVILTCFTQRATFISGLKNKEDFKLNRHYLQKAIGK